MVTLTLRLNPSTAPAANASRALNQLSNRLRWSRRVPASFAKGLSLLQTASLTHRSKNLPVQPADVLPELLKRLLEQVGVLTATMTGTGTSTLIGLDAGPAPAGVCVDHESQALFMRYAMTHWIFRHKDLSAVEVAANALCYGSISAGQ